MRGKLVDRDTGAPVEFADLAWVGESGGRRVAQTDADGLFEAEVEPGTAVSVAHTSYLPMTFVAGDPFTILQLAPRLTDLGDVIVEPHQEAKAGFPWWIVVAIGVALLQGNERGRR